MRRALNPLLAFCLLLLSGLAVARPAAAEPALWVLRDEDSTVYLFGTIHLLRPGEEWWSPRLEAAFASSDELWLETDTASTISASVQVMRYGMDMKAPLSTKLTAVQRERLRQMLAELQMAPTAMEAMRPWLAAVTLSTAPFLQEGYDPAAGVNITLQQRAFREKKTLHLFETLSEQFGFFAGLPPQEELAMLAEVLERGFMGTDLIDAMVDAWLNGDEAGLEQLVLVEEFDPDSLFYDVLLRRRNQNWAAGIRDLMAGSGTSFIAVGAAHLVGPDSLQSILGGMGLHAERL